MNHWFGITFQFFFTISSKRETNIFFNYLKQIKSINLFHSVVEARCPYIKKQIHHPLVSKNVIISVVPGIVNIN